MATEDYFFLGIIGLGSVALGLTAILAFSCETQRMEQRSDIVRECIAAGHDPLICKEVR